MTSKNKKRRLHFDFGAIFITSKHIQRFCEGIRTFCSNLHRFCTDFHQIKSFGGALAPVVGDARENAVHKKENVQRYGNSCIQCFTCENTLHWEEWMFVLVSMDILRLS